MNNILEEGPIVALERSCSRKLAKDFAVSQSDANRYFNLGDQRSNGATCIIFCISVRNSSPTNRNVISLLERIKSVYEILVMFAVTICGIFLLHERNKSSGNIFWSLSSQLLPWFWIIPILAIELCKKG